MKKLVLATAVICVWTGSAWASLDPGTPLTPGLPDQTYIVYAAQQPPGGAPGDYYNAGTHSVYSLSLGALFPDTGEQVEDGNVVVLEGGNTPNPDRSNWSDLMTFSEGDTYLTLTSYEGQEGADAATFWAGYHLSDNVVYIQESPGPYTIYTTFNETNGISITYEITPQVHNAVVPEPTTMLAGAFLLLPFAAGAVRVLRRNCGV